MKDEHSYAEEGFVIENGKLIQYKGKDDNVIIPDCVRAIGEHSLGDNIRRVYIPASVEKLERKAFDFAVRLEEIEVAADNAHYYSQDDCLIERATKKIIRGTGTSVIPVDGSVTAIGEYAFEDVECARIFIPKCITAIESRAFSGNSEVMLCIEADSKPEGWAADWDSGQGEQWDEVWWESGGADLLLEWGSKPDDIDSD